MDSKRKRRWFDYHLSKWLLLVAVLAWFFPAFRGPAIVLCGLVALAGLGTLLVRAAFLGHRQREHVNDIVVAHRPVDDTGLERRRHA